MTKRRLGELLQAEGLITEDQVRAGLEEQRKSNLFLGEALVKLGFVSEEAIAHTIVQQFSLPFLSALQYQIAIDVLNIFPERMYYEYQFIAIDKIGKVLLIVGAGLMNHDVLDELERLSGCKVCQYVSTWKDIRSTIEKHAKDLRKEQSELSSLGNMLLDDATPAPMPLPKVPSPTATVQAPAIAKPSFLKPAPTVQVPASASSMTNSVKIGPPGVIRPASPPTTGLKPGTVAPPKSALAQPPSQRLSALKPPSSSIMPKVPTASPNVTPPPGTEQPNTPAQPKSGLLGLFKKPG
jgi:hypothetical protein